jgi:hypothetical protein
VKHQEEFRKVQEKHMLLKNNKPTKEIASEMLRKNDLHHIEVKQMQALVII